MANKAIYQRTIANLDGSVEPSAEYEVINEGSGLDQIIYSDRAGTVEITPPYFADGNGKIEFYIDPGVTFRVSATGGTGTVTERYIEAVKLVDN